MLACARLGIIHSQVFGGFSGQACGSRIQDSGSRVLITMDSYWRNGTLVDHKANADIAVRTAKDLGQDVTRSWGGRGNPESTPPRRRRVRGAVSSGTHR